jgi:hypothetical protein
MSGVSVGHSAISHKNSFFSARLSIPIWAMLWLIRFFLRELYYSLKKKAIDKDSFFYVFQSAF